MGMLFRYNFCDERCGCHKGSYKCSGFLCIKFKAKIKRGWCKCPLLNDIIPLLAGNLVVVDIAADMCLCAICVILSSSRTVAAWLRRYVVRCSGIWRKPEKPFVDLVAVVDYALALADTQNMIGKHMALPRDAFGAYLSHRFPADAPFFTELSFVHYLDFCLHVLYSHYLLLRAECCMYHAACYCVPRLIFFISFSTVSDSL